MKFVFRKNVARLDSPILSVVLYHPFHPNPAFTIAGTSVGSILFCHFSSVMALHLLSIMGST